uniref:Uncharacterized protein n=1 Tax=Timema douglasi TaxID=61478 RepID=A0A7R8VNL2_TIMDO|nr:unnamed protein product [Timema douglasi]
MKVFPTGEGGDWFPCTSSCFLPGPRSLEKLLSYADKCCYGELNLVQSYTDKCCYGESNLVQSYADKCCYVELNLVQSYPDKCCYVELNLVQSYADKCFYDRRHTRPDRTDPLSYASQFTGDSWYAASVHHPLGSSPRHRPTPHPTRSSLQPLTSEVTSPGTESQPLIYNSCSLCNTRHMTDTSHCTSCCSCLHRGNSTNIPGMFTSWYTDSSNIPGMFTSWYTDSSNIPGMFTSWYTDSSNIPDSTNIPGMFTSCYTDSSNIPGMFTPCYTDSTNIPDAGSREDEEIKLFFAVPACTPCWR